MPNIKIAVAGEIATNTTPGVVIVCGNKNRYTVTFDLDDAWAAEPNRTARFVFYKNGLRLFKDVPFTGDTVTVPLLSGIDYVMVGVYAGDLHTTTPARVLCDRSILCGDAVEQITPEEKAALQAQIGDLSQLQTTAKGNLVDAINEAAKTGSTGNGSGGNSSGGNSADSSQNVNAVEPAEDDVPDVHFIVKGGMPFSKVEGDVQVLMRYISKTATIERYCTAKVQGSSSASNASYKKRNWTIKIYKDSTYEDKEKLSFKGWPAMNKFVLKAGWVIPGHLRNVGAAKIWGQIMRSRSDYDSLPEELRNSPNQGATDGFHVRVFINGMYWGIYDWIVAKDQLFGQDKDNTAHSILNSELNNQPTCAFATTSPTISGNWSEELLDNMTADTKTSMENWIKFVAGSTDAEFVMNAENYFDVQSVIDAICFDRIIMPVDNMCRNQIVFKYDTKWYMGKWDLDAILGLPPVAGQTWFAYNTAYQEGYVAHKDYGIINMLYDRTEKLFLERFKENYWRLRSGPLSEANLVEVFGRLSDRLRSIEGLLAEENASTTGNGQFTAMPNVGKDTIQQIREIVVKRCAFMDAEVTAMSGETGGETPDVPDTPETVPCTGVSLDKTELVFDGAGTRTITATVTPSDTTDTVVWVSSNPTVASITVEGNACTVQSVRNGDAIITVACGDYSASCSVAVSGFDEVNILDGVAWALGSVNGKDGSDIVSDVDCITDYVDVSSYQNQLMVLKVEGNLSREAQKIIFYDESKTFIVGAYQASVASAFAANVVPENAVYARFCANSGADSITVYKQGNNVFTADGAISGSYYECTDGTIKTYASYSRTSLECNDEAYWFENIVSGAFFADGETYNGSIEHKANARDRARLMDVPSGSVKFGINYFTSEQDKVVVIPVSTGEEIGTAINPLKG